MWWEIILVGVVVAGSTAALVVKFSRSIRSGKSSCACTGCPAREPAD
jgi:hypothetical protein